MCGNVRCFYRQLSIAMVRVEYGCELGTFWKFIPISVEISEKLKISTCITVETEILVTYRHIISFVCCKMVRNGHCYSYF